MQRTLAATTTEDDGFREIQLNTKQLIFLFMAATTVLVVAFMLGMLVGRGVRAEREEITSAEALVATPPVPTERSTPSTAEEADPRKAAPPAPAENGDVDSKAGKPSESAEEPQVAVRRDAAGSAAKSADAAKASAAAASKTAAEAAKQTASKAPPPAAAKPTAAEIAKSSAETAKRPSESVKVPVPIAKATPPPTPAPVSAKPTAPAAAPTPAAAAAASSAERSGFAVQVAAVNVRTEADAIVKRLAGKGYSAYVEVPKGAASTFRVRVGTFDTRHEAQDVADKLKKDENFKPWVTR